MSHSSETCSTYIKLYPCQCSEFSRTYHCKRTLFAPYLLQLLRPVNLRSLEVIVKSVGARKQILKIWQGQMVRSQNCLSSLACLPHFWSRQKASIFLVFSCRQSNSPFAGAWKAKSRSFGCRLSECSPQTEMTGRNTPMKDGFWLVDVECSGWHHKTTRFQELGIYYKDIYVHVAHGIWCAVRVSHCSIQFEVCLSLTSMFANRLRLVESSGKSSTLNIAIPFVWQPIGEISETVWNEFINNETMYLFCSLAPCKSKDTERN